jgi:hypothetical protein
MRSGSHSEDVSAWAGDVSAFHAYLLVCCVGDDALCLVALAPSRGPRPVGLPCCLSRRLDRFRLPGGIVMLDTSHRNCVHTTREKCG